MQSFQRDDFSILSTTKSLFLKNIKLETTKSLMIQICRLLAEKQQFQEGPYAPDQDFKHRWDVEFESKSLSPSEDSTWVKLEDEVAVSRFFS